MIQRELKHIGPPHEEMDELEKTLIIFFKKEIYIPLIKILGIRNNTIKNSKLDIIQAIGTGRITYSKGFFTGRFNASISKEIRNMGGVWSKTKRAYSIPYSVLSPGIRDAILASEDKFKEKIKKIDQHLKQIVPAEISDKLSIENIFDTAMYKVNQKFIDSVKSITVAPKLSDEERRRIASEWQNNMKLYIKDFTKKEIDTLREKVQASVFTGDRYENLIIKFQKSFDVSRSKAKFLARQETNLLMSKFKETRYTSSGVKKYKWRCVIGSPGHEVRPTHKKLDGKIFRWDNPPIVNDKGDRKNPGEDFNCRCYSIPIVDFKE